MRSPAAQARLDPELSRLREGPAQEGTATARPNATTTTPVNRFPRTCINSSFPAAESAELVPRHGGKGHRMA
jgi:hypothetical protein